MGIALQLLNYELKEDVWNSILRSFSIIALNQNVVFKCERLQKYRVSALFLFM